MGTLHKMMMDEIVLLQREGVYWEMHRCTLHTAIQWVGKGRMFDFPFLTPGKTYDREKKSSWDPELRSYGKNWTIRNRDIEMIEDFLQFNL